MPEYIYYTGIGAKKSGKHTVAEFLAIMNKEFGMDCKSYLVNKESKTCKEFNKYANKIYTAKAKNNKYKLSRKQSRKFVKLSKACNKEQSDKSLNKHRECNLEEYIEYSGAEKK